jgi:hypothetical protein
MTIDWPATITALGALVTAVGVIVIAFLNYRRGIVADLAETVEKELLEAQNAELVQTKGGIYQLGKKLDGRLQELLQLTEISARAQGVLEGRAAQKANDIEEKGD